MTARLTRYVSEAFLPHPPRAMGVAVSGGSDSMALLHLLHEFSQVHRITLRAVTVDHRLRRSAATEARRVARHCARIGVPHDTLVWEDWSGKGNLQKAARDARYAKIARWADGHGIGTVAVAHTADDQAETMLMRLSRRSGVDGLSGMRNRTLRNGITWVRPLLRTHRETLRNYLREQEIGWIDDPGNDDDRFDRIKARKALSLLSDLGIDSAVLAEVADHLAEARRALEWQTFLAAKQVIRVEAGAFVLDETMLRLQPDEIQRRMIIRAVGWISGSTYGPRRNAVSTVMAALRTGRGGTLDGCRLHRVAGRIWVFREFQALKDVTADSDGEWDGAWRLSPQAPSRHDPKLIVRALGPDGLEQCPDWRSTGMPHAVLQSTPSIWQGAQLVSAPLAGYPQNWAATSLRPPDAFFAALLSH